MTQKHLNTSVGQPANSQCCLIPVQLVVGPHIRPFTRLQISFSAHTSLDPENMRDSAVQMPEPEPTRSGCLQRKSHSPGAPTGSQHKTAHGSEVSRGAQQARYPECQQYGFQDRTLRTFWNRLHFQPVCKFSTETTLLAACPRMQGCLSISMKLPLAFSPKPDENGTLPKQPPPQQMRHNYHLLADTVSAEMARSGQLIWKLSTQKHT